MGTKSSDNIGNTDVYKRQAEQELNTTLIPSGPVTTRNEKIREDQELNFPLHPGTLTTTFIEKLEVDKFQPFFITRRSVIVIGTRPSSIL